MKPYQREFIEFAIQQGVLRFGEFTLKSGRKSPYFFNMGEIKDGVGLLKLGRFYAAAIHDSPLIQEADIIFGPAYKGITLATTTAVALAEQFNVNKWISYNRKEMKDHGEGGMIVGQSLANKKIMLIDDVISSGKTIHESKQLIEAEKGVLIGVAIALDRQEKAIHSEESAIKAISQDMNLKVSSIASLADVIEFIEHHSTDASLKKQLPAILDYQRQYGSFSC